jgi:hypothetical protein
LRGNACTVIVSAQSEGKNRSALTFGIDAAAATAPVPAAAKPTPTPKK